MCARYVQEIVLGFGLCPWAEPALRAGRVARAVYLDAAPTPAACLPFIDGFADAARVPAVEIGLLVFPRYGASWAAFDAFAERVRRADAARRGATAAARFLVAAFHPDGARTFVGPHQLISFVRRTPDPMLQFVRADILERVKASQPNASDDVAHRNHAALLGDKAAALDAVANAIRADRDTTYARLSAEGS